jgi:hypothetical protein
LEACFLAWRVVNTLARTGKIMSFTPRMNRVFRQQAAFAALIVVCLALAPSSVRADIVYQVHGDLSALSSGTSIILDFQFNPGGGTYDPATATVTGFTSLNLSLGAATPSGGGSGALPGSLTLVNATGFNEVFQAATVGADVSFAFNLTLVGPAINSPSSGVDSGTSFGLGVLDSNFNPFPVFGSNDPVLRIDISARNPVPDVSTVITPPISIAQASVPEPSSVAMFLTGLAVVGVARRYRRTGRALTMR